MCDIGVCLALAACNGLAWITGYKVTRSENISQPRGNDKQTKTFWADKILIKIKINLINL